MGMKMPDIYNVLMIITFIIGYFCITIEHSLKINKTGVAIMMAVLCWMFQFLRVGPHAHHDLTEFGMHIFNISQVVFFLFGALAIVETISAHKGFDVISAHIQVRSKKKLLWLVGLISFFLSCILDNLTSTIIMVTLIRRLVPKGENRLLIGGAVVVAANAGGSWTPIGDVTTTMLWIGGQLSTLAIMKNLFIPSLVCLAASLTCIGFFLKGDFPEIPKEEGGREVEPKGKLVFWVGVASLIFVPIFKVITGLPPFMGMLLSLSFMWIMTDLIHRDLPERSHLRLPYTISKIDISSVFFFLGILLCITALESAGMLLGIATWINSHLSNFYLISISLGLVSAVIDNVPLVAAIMGMYDLAQYPIDSNFWLLIAYCAGTGGSILIIGSAAGVAFMGMEKVSFFWYMKKIGIPALVGYLAGFATYLLMFG
jgi:NhaD family Na+/H+ antiporter